MQVFNMIVSKKDKAAGKYVPVGSVPVTIPVLADLVEFIHTPAGEVDKETNLPSYADARAQWLQDAIFAYCKSNARNKLLPETATIKDGLTIPSNWTEFTAESSRNGSEALAILREAKQAFADWLKAQGKSEAVQAALNTLFGNRNALAVQDKSRKEKFLGIINQFGESLTPEQETRFARPLENLIEACAAADADDWAA